MAAVRTLVDACKAHTHTAAVPTSTGATGAGSAIATSGLPLGYAPVLLSTHVGHGPLGRRGATAATPLSQAMVDIVDKLLKLPGKVGNDSIGVVFGKPVVEK